MNISEELWEEYHAKLRAFIRSKVFDDATCDDILHNVFLKMHSGLKSLKDKTKLKSWLYQITRNTITDYFRSQKLTVDIPEWLPQPDTDSINKVIQEVSECLQPLIQMLPDKYREAIILSELKGLTQKELAKLQGISLSGAKSRVQRGRSLLKKMLADCCRLEFDHNGRLCDYECKGNIC
jgi:RNA polymerase sigma-70 factor (ECF subfamily)